jgi:4-amino-4-deoxy-L-arabinose transferase-like glycosyltransferase
LNDPLPVRARAGGAPAAAVPRWTFLLVAVVLYACLFGHLGALGLLGPDEPRYAEVAREMAESGDWVTPQLNGQAWFEKPALYYWAAAAAFRTFGVSEFAARLPSALAAALAVLALAWAARRFYGGAAAWATLLLAPTCIGLFGFARAATPDMLFSAALAAAMVAASCATGNASAQKLNTASSSPLALIAFGIFLGAATLAKGPAAIVLAGGSIGLWAVVTRRWRDALRLAHPLALVAFALVALPWYMLCAARNPDFVRAFLFAHNIERYLTPVFHHEQPVWFFGPIVLLGLLPWTALLAGVARDAARIARHADWASAPGVFFACWAVFPVLFFSFSKSKLPGYVLPSAMVLALLLARAAARDIEEKNPLGLWLLAAVGGTFLLLSASAGYWLRRLPPEAGFGDPHRVIRWTVAAAAGGVLIALLAILPRRWAAVLAAAILTAGLVEAANRRILPQLDPYLSPRAAARAAQARSVATEDFAVYALRREWQFGLNFYFQRELPEWSPRAPRPAWVYTNAAGLAEFERLGVRFTVIESGSPQAMLLRVLDAANSEAPHEKR